jgi:hypothetical protein
VLFVLLAICYPCKGFDLSKARLHSMLEGGIRLALYLVLSNTYIVGTLRRGHYPSFNSRRFDVDLCSGFSKFQLHQLLRYAFVQAALPLRVGILRD